MATSGARDGHAWAFGLLVAVVATAVIDSLTSLASFSGSWAMLGIVAMMTLVGALAAIGPRSAPRFGRAAFVALLIPLALFSMGLAGIAEASIGAFFFLAAIALVVVGVPFALLFRRIGPTLTQGDALVRRRRANAVVASFAAAWMVIGARRSESVIAIPALLLLGALTFSVASLARKRTRSPIGAHLSIALTATIALVLGGSIWRWSYRNQYRGFVAQPTSVPDLPARKPIALTARNGGTCALYDESTIYCWGENLGRFLGDDDRPSGGRQLRGAPRTRELALGRTSACALDAERRVQCWTAVEGKLHAPGVPKTVAGLPPIEHVFLGDEIGYAAASDGSTWSFGPTEPSRAAVLVAGVRDVRALSASDQEVCALDSAGRVTCWNERSAFYPPFPPTQVALASPARSIAIGAQVHYAVLADDSVVWWGESHAHGFDQRTSATPVPLSVNEPVARVVAGRTFACVLTKSAQVACWGTAGLWPNGGFAYHATSHVAALEKIVDLVALERSMCVLDESGRIACWGGP